MPSIIQAGNAASTGLVTTGATDGILELRSGTASGGTVAVTVDAAQNLTSATAGRLFGRSNILGTVSQSAGVPTGAIIERGSNANGEFVRFADGTQICNATITVTVNTAFTNVFGTTSGNSFRSDSTWSYPSAFIAAPTITGSGGSNASVVEISGEPTTTSTPFYPYTTVNGTTLIISLLAIGRWF